jgi:hypothetical protein
MATLKEEAEELAIYEYDIALFLLVGGLLVAFGVVASKIISSSSSMRLNEVRRKAK